MLPKVACFLLRHPSVECDSVANNTLLLRDLSYLRFQGVEGASAAAHALSLPAEAYGNDVSTEGQELQCFVLQCIAMLQKALM